MRGSRHGLAQSVAIAIGLVTALQTQPALSQMPDCTRTQTRQDRDHPLTCRAFDPRGQAIDWPNLTSLLGSAPIVLLGEVHDNGSHHAIRARLLASLDELAETHSSNGQLGFQSGLVFEHIRDDQKHVLAEHNAMRGQYGTLRCCRYPSGLAPWFAAPALLAALDWEKSGWPPVALFEPLFFAAVTGRFAILAGDRPRADVRRVAREGLAALTQAERLRLELDVPFPPPLQDALLTELEASHCGLMPKSAFGNMAFAQRYRDAHLAAALASAAEAHGRAILLAGNGHVRSDRGVPYYLRAMAPGKKIATVLFLEVEDGKTDLAAYVERDPDGKPIADYIVLTPRVERPDPCVEMKKRFGAPRQ